MPILTLAAVQVYLNEKVYTFFTVGHNWNPCYKISFSFCGWFLYFKFKKRAPQDWMLVYVLHLAPQVGAKRTNRPGISTTDRGFPRARFRSRGGSFSSRARYYSGYTPPRGRGRAFRWADAETPHFRHRGRTLHLHALHLTHCLHWEERKGQTKHTAMTRISSRS